MYYCDLLVLENILVTIWHEGSEFRVSMVCVYITWEGVDSLQLRAQQ